jgi:hypothetical protein
MGLCTSDMVSAQFRMIALPIFEARESLEQKDQHRHQAFASGFTKLIASQE